MTSPVAKFILLIALFPVSIIKRFPELSRVNPEGELNVANRPILSVNPVVLDPFPPAIV